MATHYGAAVIPARPGKPRDKAKVEVGVQIAERWMLAALRNLTFFSLAEANAAIRDSFGVAQRTALQEASRLAAQPLRGA